MAPKDKVEDTIDDTPMPLVEHLAELRRRIIWSLLAFVVAMMACFAVWNPIFNFLTRPLCAALEARGQPCHLVLIQLQEGFFVAVQIAMLGGFVLAFPVISYQLWRFVAPGLYRSEKRAFLPFLVASPVMFALGAAFAFYVVTPIAFNFFLNFQQLGTPPAMVAAPPSAPSPTIRHEAAAPDHASDPASGRTPTAAENRPLPPAADPASRGTPPSAATPTGEAPAPQPPTAAGAPAAHGEAEHLLARAGIVFQGSVKEYLSLSVKFIIAFGLCFQLPVLLTLMGRAGLISSAGLKSGRKWAVVIILTLAAIATPPDVLSQLILFAAVYGLYEISIQLVALVERRRKAELRAEGLLDDHEA